VLVLACPPRDCWNREGPRWLVERMYHEREAELQARVDRDRVRVVHATAAEPDQAVAALRTFAATLSTLSAPAVDRTADIQAVCEPAGAGAGS
jgi:coenzyme F420-reducing hydrogenase delta subunit